MPSGGKSKQYTAWILAGPTATGKTDVSLELARRLGASILSADSMLIYDGMDIGTAKPTLKERGSVSMYGIDLVSPAEHFSVGAWLENAKIAFDSEKEIVVAGGTGLYINALLRGIDTPASLKIHREEARSVFEDGGMEALRKKIEQLSPGAAESLPDPNNPRRLMRLLEVILSGGDIRQMFRGIAYTEQVIAGLDFNPQMLAARIEMRINKMFESGLLEEVVSLRKKYPQFSTTAAGGIGYAEAMAVLDGELTKDAATERIAARTRQLAKRQRTWFRRQLNVSWVTGPKNERDVSRAADEVMEVWERHGKTSVSI
ncbi:MAG: tRNA (adenosine(37)-N6)-dimethylallyltransferase MiaA [Lentisphaerae bacterium]|nr:tRNA (adenosine(37)-N6)-dimethylallyltransferase MiaA [Lentisphaerota bacterium]